MNFFFKILSIVNNHNTENLINFSYSIKTEHYWKTEWLPVSESRKLPNDSLDSWALIHFQCTVECGIQSIRYICMRKFRIRTIHEEIVNASYCYHTEMPTIELKTRLCPSSKECIFETDIEGTDHYFSLRLSAIIVILNLFIISIILTVVISICFSNFIQLCLKQMYHQ